MAEEIHADLTASSALTVTVSDLAYVTLEQARSYVYQSQTADEPMIRQLIERASRIFDAACSLPDNCFLQGNHDQTESTRYFWGDGTDYLAIDPHLSSYEPTVTMPTGFQTLGYMTANPYRNPRNYDGQHFWLVRTYGESQSRFLALNERRDYFFAEFSNQIDYTGWPQGIRASVTAKWGWDATPADVQEAVLEMVALMFRSKDQGFARAVAIDGNVVINSAMTPCAQMIADGYARARGMFA